MRVLDPSRARACGRGRVTKLNHATTFGDRMYFVRGALPAKLDTPQHVGHRLAHWVLKEHGGHRRDAAVEQLCDRIGVAIAPAPAPRRAVCRFRRDLEALAEAFATRPALVRRRFGELGATL